MPERELVPGQVRAPVLELAPGLVRVPGQVRAQVLGQHKQITDY